MDKFPKSQRPRPSCLAEIVLISFLSVIVLLGCGFLIGPLLNNIFNSVFGMGLK